MEREDFSRAIDGGLYARLKASRSEAYEGLRAARSSRRRNSAA
jgi:hypothetical protein